MQEVKFTPENITELQPNEVIIFGSNLAGQHGGGLAKVANKKWGAVWGKGEGHYGQSYALPTKRTPWQTLDIEEIKPFVTRLYMYVQQHPELTFLITKVGTGLAKLTAEEIAPLFFRFIFLDNITMPEDFFNVIKAKCDKVIDKHFPPQEEQHTTLGVQEVIKLFYSAGSELYSMPEKYGENTFVADKVEIMGGGYVEVQLPSSMEASADPEKRGVWLRDKLCQQESGVWLVVVRVESAKVVRCRSYNQSDIRNVMSIEGSKISMFKAMPYEASANREYVDTVYPTAPDNDEPYKPVNFFPPGEGRRPMPNPDYVPKPVVGAKPQWRWRELRVDHLQEAIQRYKDASQSVPVDIEAELTEHQAWLKQYGPK